jgi:hypothetical protein
VGGTVMQKDIKMYDTKRTNNEYEICLAIDTGKNEEVVLGKANEEDYVTWICVNGNDYYWGHYFDNLKDALKDFIKRADGK